MKNLILILLSVPLLAKGQSSDATLTTQNNTLIYAKPYAPHRAGAMFQGLIDSKVSLLGSYSNPSWITGLAASKISGVLGTTYGGTGSSLSDPGANRLWGWDDTDNTIGFWTLGTNLSYDHSTHTLSAAGGVNPLTHNTQTTNYTLVLGDYSSSSPVLVEMNSGSSNTVTVPPNASVAFPTGSTITISQYGAGTTTVVAGSGVTINSSSGSLVSPGQYSVMVLEKRGTNEWYLWNGSVAGGSGTVTSIATTSPIQGGTITSSGTNSIS